MPVSLLRECWRKLQLTEMMPTIITPYNFSGDIAAYNAFIGVCASYEAEADSNSWRESFMAGVRRMTRFDTDPLYRQVEAMGQAQQRAWEAFFRQNRITLGQEQVYTDEFPLLREPPIVTAQSQQAVQDEAQYLGAWQGAYYDNKMPSSRPQPRREGEGSGARDCGVWYAPQKTDLFDDGGLVVLAVADRAGGEAASQ